MHRYKYVLEVVSHVFLDEEYDMEGREAYEAQPPRTVWTRRFCSERRAVKAAIRTMKRKLTHIEEMPPDFQLYVQRYGQRIVVPLPHVYLSEYAPGVPRWMGGRKYTVTPLVTT